MLPKSRTDLNLPRRYQSIYHPFGKSQSGVRMHHATYMCDLDRSLLPRRQTQLPLPLPFRPFEVCGNVSSTNKHSCTRGHHH